MNLLEPSAYFIDLSQAPMTRYDGPLFQQQHQAMNGECHAARVVDLAQARSSMRGVSYGIHVLKKHQNFMIGAVPTPLYANSTATATSSTQELDSNLSRCLQNLVRDWLSMYHPHATVAKYMKLYGDCLANSYANIVVGACSILSTMKPSKSDADKYEKDKRILFALRVILGRKIDVNATSVTKGTVADDTRDAVTELSKRICIQDSHNMVYCLGFVIFNTCYRILAHTQQVTSILETGNLPQVNI